MPQARQRIVFLDIMRAFAVFMMVQGHTVNALLGTEYRNDGYFLYSFWHYLRGFTAPIFMFTAGVAFTYLFKLSAKPFGENPRVKKGIKRFLLLLGLGYLLRYPTWRVVDFSIVSEKEWVTFFVVDALHLIAFGILALIFLLWLSERIKVDFYLVAAFVTVSVVLPSAFINGLDWKSILPLPLANYFTPAYGSFFPLFPWLAYVVAGGILGNYIALNPGAHRKREFATSLIGIGLSLIVLALAIDYFLINGDSARNVIFLFLTRTGGVVMLNGIVAMIVLKSSDVPEIVKLLGRNTLFIYVVHLVVIYGSAWNLGLAELVGPVFSFEMTLISVALMFVFVYGMIILRKKFEKIRKEKLALVRI